MSHLKSCWLSVAYTELSSGKPIGKGIDLNVIEGRHTTLIYFFRSISASPEHQEKTAARYRFGLFEADCGTAELRKLGIRLQLQAQPFRVLFCQLERPEELVTREEVSTAAEGTK